MQDRVNGAVKRNNDFTESASMRGGSSCRSGTNNKFFFFFFGLVKLVVQIGHSNYKNVKFNQL